MTALKSELQRSYHTLSGVDIQATFGSHEIGSLQGVSYTITREKAPVYVMGSPNPKSFSRGKRGIAGSLIFVMLNRSNLLGAMQDEALYWAKAGSKVRDGSEYDEAKLANVEADYGDARLSYAWYHDQLPPFDITLSAITEYGAAARMKIKGVEILNAGSGISVDDITTDENMTFVAREISPWKFIGYQDPKDYSQGDAFA